MTARDNPTITSTSRLDKLPAGGGEPAPPAPRPSFTCPVCGAVSYHPDDVANGYCGRCHDWTGAL